MGWIDPRSHPRATALTKQEEVANVLNNVFFGEEVVGFSFDVITHVVFITGIYYWTFE